MSEIIKIPTIIINGTRRESFEGHSFINSSYIRFISVFSYRFHDEEQPVNFTKIYINNGNSYYSCLDIETFMKLFSETFFKVGTTYFPFKNIKAIMDQNREYLIEFTNDRQVVSKQNSCFVFNGKNHIEINPNELISIWEKEAMGKPLVKNFKIASGGNV